MSGKNNQALAGSNSRYVFPKRVFLVRHGQSLGNLREEEYETTPDWQIPLTRQGKQEALQAGIKIKEMCGNTPIVVYFSPYKRTKETMKQILRAFPDNQINLVQQEPRIREQDFGNFQRAARMKLCKNERDRFSRFFYRFPMGESGADVYDRVSSFMESLFRLFQRETNQEYNLVLVSHGLTIRIILMRWFRWTVQEFETLVNPRNAVPVVMEQVQEDDNSKKYRLTTESWKMLHDYDNIPEKAKKMQNRRHRRRSCTQQTLEELKEVSDVEDLDLETKSFENNIPVHVLPKPAFSKSFRKIPERDTESEDHQLCGSPEVQTNEEWAEYMEKLKMGTTRRDSLRKRGSSLFGFPSEIENGEFSKFDGFKQVEKERSMDSAMSSGTVLLEGTPPLSEEN